MKRFVLLWLVIGCGGSPKSSLSDASVAECASLLSQIQEIARADTGCASDGECAVLNAGNAPPLPDCVAYVNQQGLDAALPLIAKWRNLGCGQSSTCPGGSQPRCNAGICSPE